MAFKKSETVFEGLFVIEPDVRGDDRGYFMETWNKKSFSDIGLDLNFVQDNLSFSRKGTLRGLHFQSPPFQQGKLVSVIAGSVLDVSVDLRRNSPTYGKNFCLEITSENHSMIYVPPGFAHGFLVLSEECMFAYKCTGVYHKEAEGGLSWNDPALKINWGTDQPLLSPKDEYYPSFQSFHSPFE